MGALNRAGVLPRAGALNRGNTVIGFGQDNDFVSMKSKENLPKFSEAKTSNCE